MGEDQVTMIMKNGFKAMSTVTCDSSADEMRDTLEEVLF